MNRTLALLAFAIATAPVYAGERAAVTSIKPLLIAALERGSARGVIAGAGWTRSKYSMIRVESTSQPPSGHST